MQVRTIPSENSQIAIEFATSLFTRPPRPHHGYDGYRGLAFLGLEMPSNGDPSHDRAAAKLWSVYISEAEKYDKELVGREE
jgi:hypothetical protein